MIEPRERIPLGLDTARERIKLRWDDRQMEQGLDRLRRTISFRRATATMCGATVVAGVTAWLVVAGPRLLPQRQPAVTAQVQTAAPPQRDVLQFSDGSSAVPLAADTRLAVGEDTPAKVTTRLERGRSRFVVTKNPGRIFRVESGDVVVTVLGTEFDVERAEGAVTVVVREGTVRVEWGRSERVLTAGERATFSRPAAAAAIAQEPPAEAPAAVEQLRPATASPARRETWQTLGEKARFADSWTALRSVPLAQISAPDHLLLAADVARLSGHPAQAQPYLERLITRSPSDTRAPLAAFSLGRLLMTDLGQPAAAAQRFAQARALAPSGSMAEDALAREVEAWARAGARDQARERAREYLRRYPQGQRAVAVRTFGGLP